MNTEYFFEERYKVRAYEIDQKKRMTTPALIRLMHETAMQQVVDLGISVWDLESQHISWVLIRMHFKVERLPMLGEHITVQTNPSGFEKVFTFRDYQVFDSTGQRIAWATSTWILMDTNTRKMTRIPSFILNLDVPNNPHQFDRPKSKLPTLKSAHRTDTFRVKWYDLDFNRHLNNMFYLQWMLETTPSDILSNRTLKSMDIIFKRESHYKDQIISQTEVMSDNQFIHRLLHQKDASEIAQAVSIWE